MLYMFCIFFFKQKTAYEMRISDWSSDVCSSDLRQEMDQPRLDVEAALVALLAGDRSRQVGGAVIGLLARDDALLFRPAQHVVEEVGEAQRRVDRRRAAGGEAHDRKRTRLNSSH